MAHQIGTYGNAGCMESGELLDHQSDCQLLGGHVTLAAATRARISEARCRFGSCLKRRVLLTSLSVTLRIGVGKGVEGLIRVLLDRPF